MIYRDTILISESTAQTIETIRTALPAVLRPCLPVDRGQVPDGWRLKCKCWPADLFDVTTYDLTFWHQRCAESTFVRIEPAHDGWHVTSGRELSGQVLDERCVESLADAVDVAIERMKAIGVGTDMQAALECGGQTTAAVGYIEE